MGAKLKHDMTDMVAWQLTGKPTITAPCNLQFHWFYSSRADFDNIAFAKKYVQDGMVKAGILVDDNQKYVLGFSDTFTKVDKGSEKVEVVSA